MDVINTTVLITFQLAVLAALFWFIGSIALRFFGWLWVFFGIAIALGGASTGEATAGTYGLALFNIALGGLLWTSGHAIYRARHHHWKSSVLRRIANRAPRRER